MKDLLSVREAITQADAKLLKGASAAPRVWATGFKVLDDALNGGVRAGELTLLGGPPGLGKTTLVLQAVRNIVEAGGSAIYFSYEHDVETVLERLLANETAVVGGPQAPTLPDLRRAFENAQAAQTTLREALSGSQPAAKALDALESYGDRLFIYRANSSLTDIDAIRAEVERVSKNDRPVVVVDYLQKVAVPGGAEEEDERVTLLAEALKDLALNLEVPVIAVAAGDKEGIASGKRLRMHQFRGSTALAYEADVVLILNDKFDVVARHHLVYDLGNAERFRDWVVLTVEKNRAGVDRVDLEFRKQFEHSRYDLEGNVVMEQLVDERVFVE